MRRNSAMWIDPKNGFAMDILIELFDMPGDLNKLMYGGFMKVPVAAFGKAAR